MGVTANYPDDPNYSHTLASISSYTLTVNTTAVSEAGVDVLRIIDTINSWQVNVYPIETPADLGMVYMNKFFSIDANPTCTNDSNATTFSYEIISNGGEALLDWISLNESTGKYEGKAPIASKTMFYSFKLRTTWTSLPPGSTEQIVRIQVDTKPPRTTSEIITSSISTGTVVGGGSLVVIGSTLLGNPPTGLYLILHLLQMIVLLLLIDSFIPYSLQEYLANQDLVMINLNFIPSGNIPIIDVLVKWMDSKQTNLILNSLGLESRSSFINNLSLLLTLTVFGIFHFLLRYVLVCGSENRENQGKMNRFWNWLRFKLLDIAKYVFYLRLFIEAHETMLLSSTSEINEAKLTQSGSIISFIFACGILLICILLPIIALYLYFTHRNNFDPKKKFFFMEFFTDLRNKSISRLYMGLLLGRRVLLVCIIIFLTTAPRELVYSLITSKPLIFKV